MRINKEELRYLVGDINNWYMKEGMNRYLSMTVNKRYYTPNIIELIGYYNDHSILHRKFRSYREAWNYLIGVKDGLDVL